MKHYIVIKILKAAGALPGFDAKVIPYDPAKRRTRLERNSRKTRETKRRLQEDRRRHNEKVIKEYNLKKDH